MTFADSHDFILRFNNAPTEGFEEDVGTLTSMRILNSQVVTKPQFAFPHSSYFDTQSSKAKFNHGVKKDGRDGSSDNSEEKRKASLDALWASTRKFLMWDPCNYSSTIEKVRSKYTRTRSRSAIVVYNL